MSRFTKKFFYDKKDVGEFANKERLAFVTLIKWCFYWITCLLLDIFFEYLMWGLIVPLWN